MEACMGETFFALILLAAVGGKFPEKKIQKVGKLLFAL